MSDMSQGPGWWQASDGKWYPPTPPSPPPPPPPLANVATAGVPVTTTKSTVSPSLVLGGLGVAGLVVGSLLPWAEVTAFIGTISKSGIDGDGVLTLVAGLVIAVLAWPLATGRGLTNARAVGVLCLAILAGAVCAYDIYDILDKSAASENDGVIIQVGIGLWGSALAAALAFTCGLVELVSDRPT